MIYMSRHHLGWVSQNHGFQYTIDGELFKEIGGTPILGHLQFGDVKIEEISGTLDFKMWTKI